MESGRGAEPDDYAALVERGFAALAASRLRSALAIVVVALVCMLPGFTATPPVDRDEPNNAIASRQMVESGDLLSIPVPAGVTPARGPAVYWLQAVAVQLFGGGSSAPIWVYRLPSLVGCIAAALLTWWTALAFGRPRAALFAGLALAASVMVVAEARVARPDAIILPTVILAQGALARLWLAFDAERRDWLHIGLFWTAVAASMAAGGLIGVLIVVLTVIVLSVAARSTRWLRRLAPAAGVVWLLILVAPWLVATKTVGLGPPFPVGFSGWDAITSFLARPREFNLPPGFYLVLFFGTFWPAAAFVGLAGTRIIDDRNRPLILFALGWSVPFWLLCEAARIKFPDTILPAYPALALLAGFTVDQGPINLSGRLRRAIAAGPVGVPIVFLVVLPILLFLVDGTVSWVGVALLAIATVIGYLAWRQLLAGGAQTALATSLAAAAVLYFGAFGVMIPSSEGLDISRRAVMAATSIAGCPNPEVAGAGYTEPSLRFFAGDSTRFGSGDNAADFLAAGGCRVAIVEIDANTAFLSRADDIGLGVAERGRLQGHDFAEGRPATIILYTPSDVP